MTQIEEIKRLLDSCNAEQRRQIFDYLRREFPIHSIEARWGTEAEIILEAIDRSSDLSQRGVRGLIAEAAFEINVVNNLTGWRNLPIIGDASYDFLLEDNVGRVRVQLKMQRLKAGRPMWANEGYRFLPRDMFTVEIQRTRAGRNSQSGEDTRPYRFGEFDILAVSMHPSTRNWSSFMFTVADWLLPRPGAPSLMLKFQPVPQETNDVWTSDFEPSVRWLRSGEQKRIWVPTPT